MTDAPAATNIKRQSAQRLAAMMAGHYQQLHQRAAHGAPVVWCAIIVPIELLHGFDLVVGVPENHAAMCAAKGAGAALAQQAEGLGYSPDLCSYARICLGAHLGDASASPSHGLPRPRLLISDNNNCSLLAKWFDVYRRAWGAEHFVLDVPFCYGPQRPADRAYIRRQLEDLIAALERLTGQRCDRERIARALALSDEAMAHWKRLLALAARRPAGVTAFDTFAHMAPYITALRGTPQLVEHTRLLADEAEALAEAGQAPVPDERYRLLWDNIAPWHQLRAMSTRLAGLGANIAYATYTSCMGALEGGLDHHPYDGGDPLDHLARIQNFSVCPYGLELRFQAMRAMLERFGLDGVVFASNRSCKVYSVMQMDLMRRVRQELGAPAVMIDVDHADPRAYSEEAAMLRIEALLESIEAAR